LLDVALSKRGWLKKTMACKMSKNIKQFVWEKQVLRWRVSLINDAALLKKYGNVEIRFRGRSAF
jgi:hypothetical protein